MMAYFLPLLEKQPRPLQSRLDVMRDAGGGGEMPYDIGEKPGRGTYRCTHCHNWEVTLDDHNDRLPPCGNCGDDQRVSYIQVD